MEDSVFIIENRCISVEIADIQGELISWEDAFVLHNVTGNSEFDREKVLDSKYIVLLELGIIRGRQEKTEAILEFHFRVVIVSLLLKLLKLNFWITADQVPRSLSHLRRSLVKQSKKGRVKLRHNSMCANA